MAASNQQKVWKFFLWGVAALALLIFFGLHYKVVLAGWIVGAGVYISGFGYQVYEYIQDDETLLPDILMIIGTAIVGIWGAA